MEFNHVVDYVKMFVSVANCVEFKHFGSEPYTYKVHEKNKFCVIIRDGKAVFVFRVEDNVVHLVDGAEDCLQFDATEELTHFLFVWSSVIPEVYGCR